ncbi:MAG: PLDc_N domain-containing protein [Candidatus Omnitrophica bacterium]|nr:PLDc_N domain-containing protein [Candidatus Omnitrophota bacterium]
MEIPLGCLLYLFIVIIALFDILKGSLSVVKKALWGVLVFALPVAGIVLYYLLGRTEKA